MISVVDSCRLYRNLYDIIHPSISRKNISNYKIIFNDNLIPVRIFYPNRDTKLGRIIIYIHGDKTNDKVYEEIAKRTDSIVIFLEYRKEKIEIDCNNMIEYLLKGLTECNISLENVLLMGDDIESNFLLQLENENRVKKIFIMPNFHLKKQLNMDNMMIITEDNKKEESDSIYQIDERLDDFILHNNITLNEKIYRIINKVVG